jgi:MFS family permease
MQTQIKRSVASASIGGLIEMYDFVIYIFLSPIIATLFFPKTNHSIALLLTLAIFAIGYLARPLGGLLFGHITDLAGRRTGLMVSVMMMACPIFLIAVLPSYQSFGIFAPIALLVLRIIQGLSVGGEFPSSVVFVIEKSSLEKRGWNTAWIFFGINCGIVIGSAVAALLEILFSHAQVYGWAWRIPFFLGSLLAVLGFYIRSKLYETPIFTEHQKNNKLADFPLATVIRHDWPQLILGIALVSMMAAMISLVFLTMPHYLAGVQHMSGKEALWTNVINVIIFSCMIPFFGKLSDKIGRKPLLIVPAILMLIFAHMLFSALKTTGTETYISLFILDVICAMAIGPIPASLAELFPTHTRTTGVAITYNISFAIVGGLAPLIITALIARTHDLAAPSYYLMITAAVSLIAAIILKESRHKDLA